MILNDRLLCDVILELGFGYSESNSPFLTEPSH